MNKLKGLTKIDEKFLDNFKYTLISKNNKEIIQYHIIAKELINYKCELLINELERLKNEAINNINCERSSH